MALGLLLSAQVRPRSAQSMYQERARDSCVVPERRQDLLEDWMPDLIAVRLHPSCSSRDTWTEALPSLVGIQCVVWICRCPALGSAASQALSEKGRLSL